MWEKFEWVKMCGMPARSCMWERAQVSWHMERAEMWNPVESRLCKEAAAEMGSLSLISKTRPVLQGLAMAFFLLWTRVMLSSPFGFLLAGEGIFLNSISGNFESGLSEIPGTESLKSRLRHDFPGHVFFFLLGNFRLVELGDFTYLSRTSSIWCLAGAAALLLMEALGAAARPRRGGSWVPPAPATTHMVLSQ